MITKDVYQKRLLANKTDTVVFNEVFDYLESKSTACRIDAENLQQKGIDTLSREDYERIIENLSKSLAYSNILKLLQNELCRRTKDFIRLQRQYEHQLGKNMK